MPDKPTTNNRFLQLWFARVGDLTTPIEQNTRQLLSTSEEQRLQATKNTNKRREYLLSRALIRHALNEYIKPKQLSWQFVEQPNTPPSIINLPQGLHFNLTHSNGIICFALANCPIGVDLEKKKERRDFTGLAKTVMNSVEIAFLAQHPEALMENFYRLWCAKEAFFKMLPRVQQSHLSLKDICIPTLQKNRDQTLLTSVWKNEWVLAIAAANQVEKIDFNHYPTNDQEIENFTQSFATLLQLTLPQ